MSNTDLSIAIDLETTGLDPHQGYVLEVACALVTPNLVPLDGGIAMVAHLEPETFHVHGDVEAVTMHRNNGLTEESANSPFTLFDVDTVMSDYLAGLGATPGGHRLINNNAAFERSWLPRHLPQMSAYLNHRNLDVSALRETARVFFPQIAETAPPRAAAHRAMPDVHACLAELRHYTKHLMPRPQLNPSELTEFINHKSVPGEVAEWDLTRGDDIPLANFGPPDEAREFALRVYAAADFIEMSTNPMPQSG